MHDVVWSADRTMIRGAFGSFRSFFLPPGENSLDHQAVGSSSGSRGGSRGGSKAGSKPASALASPDGAAKGSSTSKQSPAKGGDPPKTFSAEEKSSSCSGGVLADHMWSG